MDLLSPPQKKEKKKKEMKLEKYIPKLYVLTIRQKQYFYQLLPLRFGGKNQQIQITRQLNWCVTAQKTCGFALSKILYTLHLHVYVKILVNLL